jgi:hypothetical protein
MRLEFPPRSFPRGFHRSRWAAVSRTWWQELRAEDDRSLPDPERLFTMESRRCEIRNFNPVISESRTANPHARRPRKGLRGDHGRRSSRRRRDSETSAAGSLPKGFSGRPAGTPRTAGKPADFWTFVVPEPVDPGRRKVGSEARLPGEVGMREKGFGKSRPGDLGRVEVGSGGLWDAVRRGRRSLGLPVVSGMRSRGLQGAGGGGRSRRSGQAAKKPLDF